MLHAFQGRHASAGRLAEEACRVEIDLCAEPIGKQDQYAAAFGGLNLFEFQPGGRVDVTPVMMPPERRHSLAARIIAFYTGVTRSARSILEAQTESVTRDVDKQNVLRRMADLAYSMKDELDSGNLDSFGEIFMKTGK